MTIATSSFETKRVTRRQEDAPQMEGPAELEAQLAAEADAIERSAKEMAELLGVNVNPAQLKARARALAESRRGNS